MMEPQTWTFHTETGLISIMFLFYALGILAGYFGFAYCEWVYDTAISSRRSLKSASQSTLLLTSLCNISFSAIVISFILYTSTFFHAYGEFSSRDNTTSLYFIYRLAGSLPVDGASIVPFMSILFPLAIGFLIGLALSWPRRGAMLRIVAATGAVYVVFRLAHIVIGVGMFDFCDFYTLTDKITLVILFLFALIAFVFLLIRGLKPAFPTKGMQFVMSFFRWFAILANLVLSIVIVFVMVKHLWFNAFLRSAIFLAVLITYAVMLVKRKTPSKPLAGTDRADRYISKKAGLLTTVVILVLAIATFIGDSIAGPVSAVTDELTPPVYIAAPTRPKLAEMKPYTLYCAYVNNEMHDVFKVFPNMVVAAASDSRTFAAILPDGTVALRSSSVWKDIPKLEEISPGDPNPAVDIAVGAMHILLLMEDGTVRALGSNDHGQLGQGDRLEREGIVTVPGLKDIVMVWANRGLSAAIRCDGTAYWWGEKSADSNTYLKPDSPERVPDLHISAFGSSRYDYYAFLLMDYTGRCYGFCNYGGPSSLRFPISVFCRHAFYQCYLLDGRGRLRRTGDGKLKTIVDEPVSQACFTNHFMFYLTTSGELFYKPLPNTSDSWGKTIQDYGYSSRINVPGKIRSITCDTWRLLILAEE